MKKKIKKIVTTEKLVDGSGDWRSFAIVTDSIGRKWELRGYGDSREWAERDVIARFHENEEDWDLEGHQI